MAKAIEETERRREIQHAYNIKHGKVPVALNKKVTDIMDVGEDVKGQDTGAAPALSSQLSPGQIADQIKTLESQMLSHARELEFEKAAQLRDQIQQLQHSLIHA